MTHPLRYLIWISTWFDDLSHFKTEYDKLAGYINHCEDELTVPNKPMRGPTSEQVEIIAMLEAYAKAGYATCLSIQAPSILRTKAFRDLLATSGMYRLSQLLGKRSRIRSLTTGRFPAT
ncbi:hypothetical protein ACO0LC_18025 [Undibacterium sp. JH2W]|uniref:hypothetical protein n=1 Tax=Undibacterium sp. JH2W TaxID=3413037 RepID=UPI003BEF8E6E